MVYFQEDDFSFLMNGWFCAFFPTEGGHPGAS